MGIHNFFFRAHIEDEWKMMDVDVSFEEKMFVDIVNAIVNVIIIVLVLVILVGKDILILIFLFYRSAIESIEKKFEALLNPVCFSFSHSLFLYLILSYLFFTFFFTGII